MDIRCPALGMRQQEQYFKNPEVSKQGLEELRGRTLVCKEQLYPPRPQDGDCQADDN